MLSLIKKPSAWIPLALSAGILGVMCLYFAGVMAPEPVGDEGTGAHLFQIWLVLEPLAIAFFAFKWLDLKPREALIVLGLQIALALVPVAIVFSLNL